MTRDLLPYEVALREEQRERARQQHEAAQERERTAREERERHEADVRARRAALVAASEEDRVKARELRALAAQLTAKAEARLRFAGTVQQFEETWNAGVAQVQGQEQKQVDAQRREALTRWDDRVGRFNL